MRHYVVTEGRAKVLDTELNVLNRATYGIDWLVVYASSPADAVRQWDLYTAGIHPTQDKLALEAATYRSPEPDYVPSWEAEADVIGHEVNGAIDRVKAEAQELDGLKAALEQTQAKLQRPRKPQTARPSKTRKRRRAA